MSPIQVGFIGLSSQGWAATSLAPPLLKAPLVQTYSLTALSTTSEASASASSKKYSELTGHPVKPYHGDSVQIANDANVDLVAVSVKVPGHRDAALPVIHAGKDLFVEWPLGNGLDEAIELADAANKKGIRTVIGLQARQSPALKKVRELVSSGKIGHVITSTVMATVQGYWGKTVQERNDWIVDEKNGASLLSIPIGHFTDIFTLILGDFTSITATSQNSTPTVSVVDEAGNPTGRTVAQTVPNQFAISGILKSGALINMHWRGGLPPAEGRTDFFWHIDGTDGNIRVEGPTPLVGVHEPKIYLNGEEVKLTEEGSVDELGNTGRTWLEFTKGEKGNYANINDAVKNHRILDAIDRSAKEGRRIDLV